MKRFHTLELSQHMGWIVPLLALFLVVVGCTGNSSSNTRSIAFVSTAALDGSNAPNAAGNIWFAKADGSAAIPLTRLTAPAAGVRGMNWSPDGTRLAFTSTRALDGSDALNLPDGTPNVWLMNADGSGVTPLTHMHHAAQVGSIWSQDGTKLAFGSDGALDGSDSATGNPHVVYNTWVMNADGSNAIPITKLTALGSLVFDETWSPDGKKLAFLSTGALDGSDALNPATNIWMSNADGSGLTPLTTLTASKVFASSLTWAPNGNQLAFDSNRALDGSNAASPDVFVTNVWVINADGSGATPLTRLTAPGIYALEPSWSPDRSRLAYDSNRALDGSDSLNGAAANNIWVMNADGSGSLPLTKLKADPGIPGLVWSPDGSEIGLTSERALDGSDGLIPSGSSNIWLINADGSGAKPLTKFTSSGVWTAGPAWRP